MLGNLEVRVDDKPIRIEDLSAVWDARNGDHQKRRDDPSAKAPAEETTDFAAMTPERIRDVGAAWKTGKDGVHWVLT